MQWSSSDTPFCVGDKHAKPLLVNWARDEAEVRAAQRLRYTVFAEELGARIGGAPGLDNDEFDAHCDHLLVRDPQTFEIVGTYRVLPPHRAMRLGRLYAQGEFNIEQLAPLRHKMVEVGRSCVHRDYRRGMVIMSLWTGLAEYMLRHGYETMLGCASVSVADGGHFAANLYRALEAESMTTAQFRAFPRVALPIDSLQTGASVTLPPLIKGYLRLGAKICGAPAFDPAFNTADFLTLFNLSEINPRYARHFLVAEQRSECF
ncbi:GNAT family N-acetyltransferase [Mycoavidus cysteinexigens]|uniref:GNAT family N-acetyltransferase n=1 Tax=Mycoavidus cysteinexigens TaxID=1553431 RepID=UPI0028BE3693|nr:GNAT family N-acyltransferase [Mycoavidus cysteinexigens]